MIVGEEAIFAILVQVLLHRQLLMADRESGASTSVTTEDQGGCIKCVHTGFSRLEEMGLIRIRRPATRLQTHNNHDLSAVGRDIERDVCLLRYGSAGSTRPPLCGVVPSN